MRDKNIDHPLRVGKLKCCQLRRVRPEAHGSNGLCVIAGNTDTAKKSLKRLAFLTKGNNKGVAMTKEEANELYEKFRVTGREAFSLHEIWLMIFWNGKNPREFDKQDSEH